VWLLRLSDKKSNGDFDSFNVVDPCMPKLIMSIGVGSLLLAAVSVGASLMGLTAVELHQKLMCMGPRTDPLA